MGYSEFFNTNAMRAAIDANPGWTALEALAELSGVVPLWHQRKQALEGVHAGQNHADTVASIPDQIDSLCRLLDGHFPDFPVSAMMIWPCIQLTTPGAMTIPPAKPLWVFHLLATLSRDDLRAATAMDVHPVIDVYWDELGRAPDAAGLKFWLPKFNDYPTEAAFREAFRAGIESEAAA